MRLEHDIILMMGFKLINTGINVLTGVYVSTFRIPEPISSFKWNITLSPCSFLWYTVIQWPQNAMPVPDNSLMTVWGPMTASNGSELGFV